MVSFFLLGSWQEDGFGNRELGRSERVAALLSDPGTFLLAAQFTLWIMKRCLYFLLSSTNTLSYIVLILRLFHDS